MFAFRTAVCAASALAGLTLFAQTQTTYTSGDNKAQRSFAVVDEASIGSFQGSWNEESPVLRYAHQHPTGRYVVFTDKGVLYRLDNGKRLDEIREMYAPLKELSKRQEALAQAQQPLARQQALLARTQQPLAQEQRSLAQQQRGASNPADQGRLGRAQGILGEQQGDLGRAQGILGEQQGQIGAIQGELGRKQGEIARANYTRMQTIFDGCLADGSCSRVSS